MNKIHYLFTPIFLNVASLLVQQPCKNLICLIEGRGFPIPFYNTNFYLPGFLIGLIFWVIVYAIMFNFFKIIFKKNN